MSIPENMQALVQRHDGFSGTAEGPSIDRLDRYLELRTIAVPEIKEGQVLIRMRMASINPSDLHFIKGEYGRPRVRGSPAGFEGVGDVVAGKGSRCQSLIGQRVAFTVDLDGSGAWADFAVTPATSCIRVRDEMRDEDAAGLVVNPVTAMAMFELVRQAETASFVMTAANSQLCKFLTTLGRDHDIAPIAIIRDKTQAAHLLALGARQVLDLTAADFGERLRAVIKAEKPRILLDAVGNQHSADIFTAMPNRARWIVYGKLDPEPPTIREMGQFVFMQKEIAGFWLTRWFQATPPAEQGRLVNAVQERFITGKWETEVSDQLSLGETMERLGDRLRQSKSKVMLVP